MGVVAPRHWSRAECRRRCVARLSAVLLLLLAGVTAAWAATVECGEQLVPAPAGEEPYLVSLLPKDEKASVDDVVTAMQEASGSVGRVFSLTRTFTLTNGFSGTMNGAAVAYLLETFGDSVEHVSCDGELSIAASKLYCAGQPVDSLPGPDTPVILTVTSPEALQSAQAAVPEAQFTLLPTSLLGTFLTSSLGTQQAVTLLEELGKELLYITCDEEVGIADKGAVKVMCRGEEIDPVAGEYMVVMSGGQGGEEMRAMADWLAAQGGRDFFTLRNINAGQLSTFIAGSFSAEAIQALGAQYPQQIGYFQCDQQVGVADITIGPPVVDDPMTRVQCNGERMTEPVAGQHKYLVRVAGDGSAATQRVVTIVAWLSETYPGSKDIGTVTSFLASGTGPYLTAQMTWAAVEGLMTSGTGAGVALVQCHEEVGLLGAGMEKVQCGGEQMAPVDAMRSFIVRIDTADKDIDGSAKLAEIVAWLEERYGDSPDKMAGAPQPFNSLLLGPYFTAELSWAALTELLAEHGGAVAAAECDVAVGIAEVTMRPPDGSGGEGGAEEGEGVEEDGLKSLGDKVQCGGEQMAPVDGMTAFIVRIDTADKDTGGPAKLAEIVAWLEERYGDSPDKMAGAPQPHNSLLLGPYLMAKLSWAALTELLAEHGGAVAVAECDVAVGVAEVTMRPPDGSGGGGEGKGHEELLQSVLMDKFRCQGATSDALPSESTPYLILLEPQGAQISPAELVAWLTENYPEHVNHLRDSNRLLPIVTGRLTAEAAEAMLLVFHDSVRFLECDTMVETTTVSGKSAEASEDSAAARPAAAPLLPVAMALVGMLLAVDVLRL